MDTVLQRINTAAVKLLEPLTPEEAYETIVNEGLKLVGGDDGLLVLEKDGIFFTAYGSSPATRAVITRNKGYTYTAFVERRSFVIHETDIKKSHPEISKLGVKSVIFIPLSYKRKSMGVLVVRSYKHDKFINNEPEILELFGSMASLAIRNIHLYDVTKRSLELRDIFIAFASHELRTPLTPINGYIQLLQRKLAKEEPIQPKWVDKLADETKRLTNLVEELLVLNKIRTGKLQFTVTTFDFHDVITAATDRLRFAHKHKIKVAITGKIEKYKGDKDKLIQAIYNLLENSAKHSSEDTTINLNVEVTTDDYIISIEDKGRGISAEDIPYVFEIFYKGRQNHKEGMGIGLYLVKTIIEKHHGTIQIQSELNKGTTITIILPRHI